MEEEISAEISASNEEREASDECLLSLTWRKELRPNLDESLESVICMSFEQFQGLQKG